MQLKGRQIKFNPEEERLLSMAGTLSSEGLREIEAFAEWLISTPPDDVSALSHGARCVLAEHFRAALVSAQPHGQGRIWAVSRHVGALAWLYLQGLRPHCVVAHLNVSDVAPGDIVVGVLPLALTVALELRSVQAWHVVIDAAPQDRGIELGPARMNQRNARLERYEIRHVESNCDLLPTCRLASSS